MMLGLFALINILLVGFGMSFPGWGGLIAILLTSFFMSLMFPTIFALGIKGLGPDTKIGGSLLVMAIVGGAAFTPIMGLISDATGSMATAMLVPLVCYVFIAWYSFVGSRLGTPALAAVQRED